MAPDSVILKLSAAIVNGGGGGEVAVGTTGHCVLFSAQGQQL